jgi:hypothetical protein
MLPPSADPRKLFLGHHNIPLIEQNVLNNETKLWDAKIGIRTIERLVENYTILISYYSFVNNPQKLDFFQKRLKTLLQNKAVSSELDASAIKFSRIRASCLDTETSSIEKQRVWQELRVNQEKADFTDKIIQRELAFQEQKIQIR